jgi:hypothetical protein
MITFIFRTTRPDTSVPFFVDCPDNVELVAKWVDLSSILDVKHTKEISDDQLILTTVYEFENSDIASMYLSLLQGNLPEWYAERNTYYETHGHTLVATRVSSKGESTVFFRI